LADTIPGELTLPVRLEIVRRAAVRVHFPGLKRGAKKRRAGGLRYPGKCL
jgi:hypothetical protein